MVFRNDRQQMDAGTIRGQKNCPCIANHCNGVNLRGQCTYTKARARIGYLAGARTRIMDMTSMYN